VRLRAGSAARAAGVGLACVMPRLSGRAGAVGAAYAVGWPMGKPGMQLLVWVPEEDAEPWQRALIPFASSAVSWTTVMVLASTAVRRSKLPAPVGGALLGGLVLVADSLLVGVGERAMAMADAAREKAEAAAASTDVEG
jgi:hypothetical protein